ncbi:MAG TPA: carboxypeptidase-like regulatory domain-containing protein [Acidobacteriaceae bacterium]|nr:carboxypeptidase-like regulatory domain-containing protein [Acidobacteriaceae bacterium]
MLRKNIWSSMMLAALLAILLPFTTNALAQGGAAGTGKVHGLVNDPTGAPITAGTVSLYAGGMTSPSQDAAYNFPVDSSGNYHGDDVKAGSYTVVFRAPDTPKDKVVDQLDNVQVTPGQDTAANIDMSRAAYLAKLTPEQRKQIEETAKKNQSILKENAQIKNLNADLGKARQDDKDKNYADAVALMQKDSAARPDAAVLWVELGIAQEGLAAANHTAAGQQGWTDAEANLQKGITMDAAAKKPDAGMEGAANDKLGEAYAYDGKIPESIAAYDAAAKVNPPGAGMYFENATIMMDREGPTSPAAADAVVTEADKAIAADPNRPIPYYLKARALVAKATVDPKTQKIVAPSGCAEAYQKYLQLAPNGPFAPDAKQVLAEMSATQESSFKSKKH